MYASFVPSVDIQSFSVACQNLFSPGLQLTNFPERSFAFLRKLVAAEFVGCGTLDRHTSRLNIGLDQPHPRFANAMEAFGAVMAPYPFYNFDTTVNDGRPFRRSQFVSDRQFRDTDMFWEVYRPLDIDNHCAIYIPTRPGESLFFFLERKGGPDFSDDELALLEAAQAQITNARALAWAQASVLDEIIEPELLSQAGLTPREAEILFWITHGKSNIEISILLKLALYTVKDHITSIFNKTGVGNRLAAIVWAQRTCLKLRHAGKFDGFVNVSAPVPPEPGK